MNIAEAMFACLDFKEQLINKKINQDNVSFIVCLRIVFIITIPRYNSIKD